MQLKFTNSKFLGTWVCVVLSVAVIFIAVLGLILSYYAGQTEDNILALTILAIILLTIWIIYFVCLLLFKKTIIVTENQIIIRKYKKIIWTLNKEDIYECVYQPLTAKDFIIPSPNATAMFFKPKINISFSKKTHLGFELSPAISVSLKNVREMIKLGYNIRIINNSFEQ